MTERKFFKNNTSSSKHLRKGFNAWVKAWNWVETQPKKPSNEFIKNSSSAKFGVKFKLLKKWFEQY